MRIIRATNQDMVPASHEDPQNPGVLKRVIAVKDDLQVGRVQMVNWARLPEGNEFQTHFHEDMEEVFIMIRGQAQMYTGDQVETLGVGDTAIVAPREMHRMRNVGAGEVEYIVFGISSEQGGKTVVVSQPNMGTE